MSRVTVPILVKEHPSVRTVPAFASRSTALEALFRGFADPTRIRILNLLAAGELCVCDIVELLGLPQPTVSRHLAYLRRCGLVEVSRAWRFAHYRLRDSDHPVQRNLLACVRSCFQGIGSLDAERREAEQRARQRRSQPC